jgi:hypothetical protein
MLVSAARSTVRMTKMIARPTRGARRSRRGKAISPAAADWPIAAEDEPSEASSPRKRAEDYQQDLATFGRLSVPGIAEPLYLRAARGYASRCYDACMTKVRTTLTVDSEVLRAVRVRAARTGKGDSEVIEEALRRDLGLDLLDRLWAANQLPEEEALALGVEAQHSTRPPRP